MSKSKRVRHLAARAAPYVAGLLDREQAAEVERHILSCLPCARQVQDFREIAAQLALALPERNPPPGVRERLLAGTAAVPDTARVLVRSNEIPWRPSGISGLEVKQLFVDAATGNVTSLIRMSPGAVYPSHHHFGLEHCYVIEGDIAFNDHALQVGDYEVALPSTIHSSVTTTHGCLLLIVNNLRDELMADPA